MTHCRVQEVKTKIRVSIILLMKRDIVVAKYFSYLLFRYLLSVAIFLWYLLFFVDELNTLINDCHYFHEIFLLILHTLLFLFLDINLILFWVPLCLFLFTLRFLDKIDLSRTALEWNTIRLLTIKLPSFKLIHSIYITHFICQNHLTFSRHKLFSNYF